MTAIIGVLVTCAAILTLGSPTEAGLAPMPARPAPTRPRGLTWT